MWCISDSVFRGNMRFVMKIFPAMFLFIFISGARADDDVDIAKLYKEYADAIVTAPSLDSQGQENRLGTGFSVMEEGVIVTNYHVVADSRKVIVKLRNNKAYKMVQLLNADPAKDIAVLRIFPKKKLDTVKLGNSRRVKTGQRVIAIGNPLGLENTVSDGLVSSIREADGIKLLQISVPLSSGSSGGPLFDTKGRVVGITTASLTQGQNLNFAVPVNYVKKLLPDDDAPKNLSGKIHAVKRDETLYSLARRFNTTVQEIIEINQLRDPMIYRGQKLKIPEAR